MGTSGSSRGTGSNIPLVPTWLDDPPSGPLPGSEDVAPPNGGDGEAPDTQGTPQTPPTIQLAPESARFQAARRNFSIFAGSAGNDSGALRRAVRDYVRSGTGGAGGATRRMGASRQGASGVLSLFRGFQRDGVAATLRRLHLDNLVGRPPEEVFLGLTNVICQDGGSIDEGIARDAWLKTVAELDELGIDDMGSLSTEQMQEIVMAFVAYAIEARLFQEIGANGLRVAMDLAAIEAFEAQFRSYVRRAVRDSFSNDLSQVGTLSDRQIRDVVDQTYRETWELLDLWGDVQG
jgi:hypothetical protein